RVDTPPVNGVLNHEIIHRHSHRLLPSQSSQVVVEQVVGQRNVLDVPALPVTRLVPCDQHDRRSLHATPATTDPSSPPPSRGSPYPRAVTMAMSRSMSSLSGAGRLPRAWMKPTPA